MKERPISVVTGQVSQRGKRLQSADGLTWKQRNRDAVNARRRALYAGETGKHRQRVSEYRKEQREKVNAYNAAYGTGYRMRLRAEMILAYGSKCACCGETEPLFLQLDHIYNDGHIDRKTHKTSTKLFAALKKIGWPQDRYQLLCANCNFGKMLNGGLACPHAKNQS